jgi:hypothetical protein
MTQIMTNETEVASSEAEIQGPLNVLPYDTPAPRPSRGGTVFSIIISICLGIGSACITFAMNVMNHVRDDVAGVFAVGVGLVVLGLALCVSLLWLRRIPR